MKTTLFSTGPYMDMLTDGMFTPKAQPDGSFLWINPAQPYPGAYVNWALGPEASRHDSVMCWRENFGAWWKYWGDGITPPRDTDILDRIYPNRIKTLGQWMRRVGYNGANPGGVLKMAEDWASKKAS
ncbi:hypothetical protein F52700_2352 [Fusarium sp. NRRL 52700]|nr:hypothetical protein F52700_2352 [Fusarium sp. NRRL 52700]